MQSTPYEVIFLLLTVLLGGAASAQRTWNVGTCPGPGIDFLDLPPAIAAAAPGDTIRVVAAGSCTNFYGFTAPHIDKPLTIMVASAFATPGEPNSAPLRGEITITGIPASERVVLSNLTIWSRLPNQFMPPLPSGIRAWDCGGEIVLEDVDYESYGFTNSHVRFTRCARVVMHACWFYPAEEPLTFEDSTAALSSSVVFMRGYAPFPWTQSPSISREGLLVRNSAVSLSNTQIDGAPVIYNQWTGSNGPSPGAVVESGILTLGPVSLLRGGYDPNFIFNPQYPNTFYGLRVPLSGTGAVIQDPSAIITTVEPFTRLPQVRQVPAVFHQWVVQNQPYVVDLFGPPGGFALLAAGSSSPTPLPVGFGDLWIVPASLLTVGIVPLSQQYGDATIPLHCSPGLPMGHVFAFQAAMLAPNGLVSLSLPSPFTVAWEPGRVP